MRPPNPHWTGLPGTHAELLLTPHPRSVALARRWHQPGHLIKQYGARPLRPSRMISTQEVALRCWLDEPGCLIKWSVSFWSWARSGPVPPLWLVLRLSL
ncbi:hypothetical protein VTO73DRAFT_6618 [Trametes versicolor]